MNFDNIEGISIEELEDLYDETTEISGWCRCKYSCGFRHVAGGYAMNGCLKHCNFYTQYGFYRENCDSLCGSSGCNAEYSNGGYACLPSNFTGNMCR